ncbi:MAG: DpnII family type II restriction endonuclease [Pseudomonadota bacterium]
MKRYRQTLGEILEQLSPVDTSWRDAHADRVIQRLQQIPQKADYNRTDLLQLLDTEHTSEDIKPKEYFEAGLTTIRLFLDLSKDELTAELRERLGGTLGITRARKDPKGVCETLEAMGILERMNLTVNTPISWSDLLTERLKGGRGSAIKGQRRGRYLEDFVEQLLIGIFGENAYDARCQFTGATGTSTEKTDFAIPSKDDPGILIEAKAYGATGSKQTDVLGDITRIVSEKRNDTHFLLVTDGITWRDRTSDLAKLVTLQNQGKITRIYTQSMAEQLEADLGQLKEEHGL